MAIWITLSCALYLNCEKQWKAQPSRWQVQSCGCCFLPAHVFFFLSLPLPCSSSPACSMRLCQQVLDDPNEDHLYMGKRALAFCHPCSGSYASHSPGVLSIQPLRLVPPTLSCSSGPHTEGCTLGLKQEVERSSSWDFIWVSCSSVF